MAASTYPFCPLHQEQGFYRAPKEFQTFLPSPTTKKENLGSSSLHHLVPPKVENPWKSVGWMLESDQYVKLDSSIKRPVLIDVQDIRSDSMLFSFGIAEQYTRQKETIEALEDIQGSSSNIKTVTVPPLKSHTKIKLNPLPKKRNSRKTGKERDLYRRSYFHACESLLSLISDKRHGNAAIMALKQCDPELPQLLTQLSAGIAGTGLAVLFSVGCKAAGGRVPFCTSRLLNTGVGFGLVWLSWAMNKLRDCIIYISKNTSKVGVRDKEVIRRVNKCVNDIFFRAATVMVFAMLRFA